MRKDIGVLALRLTFGGLLAGHGAQKLFGSFNGRGLHGTGNWMETLGFQPGKPWAALAGLSEFGGGVLTALGLFGALGPIATIGAMSMAARTVHADKPIWVTEGGAELPVLNIAVGTALALNGPGTFSADRLFGIKVPWWLSWLAVFGVMVSVVYGLNSRQQAPQAQEPPQPEERSSETQQPIALEEHRKAQHAA